LTNGNEVKTVSDFETRPSYIGICLLCFSDPFYSVGFEYSLSTRKNWIWISDNKFCCA